MASPVYQSNTASRATFGITLKGQPCKKCIQIQRFCHLHRSQERLPVPPVTHFHREVSPEERPPPRAPHPSFNVGATRDVICPPCVRLGRDCAYHAFQKDPANTFGDQHQLQQQRERHEVSSQRPVVYGITLKGKPCKICLVKGDFCKKHESQRVANTATTTVPLVRVQAASGQQDLSGATPFPTCGITVKGKPCKICISKGDFCGWHESQRLRQHDTFLGQERLQSASSPHDLPSSITVYGKTVKGKPCKICIRKGDYCHFHVDQKPLDETTTPTISTPTTPFAVTRNGMPCKLCVRKGDICHIHANRAETKDSSTGISRRHQARRFLSLVLLGAMFHYAIFVGVLQGTSVARLQDTAVEFYKGINVDVILEQGVQTYNNLGLDSIMERGLKIKDAVLHHDWIQQASSLPVVQTVMNTAQIGSSKQARASLDHARYHQDIMNFIQSNETSGTNLLAHGDISEVELS